MEERRIIVYDFKLLMSALCELTARNNSCYERLLLTREFCTTKELDRLRRLANTVAFSVMRSPYVNSVQRQQTKLDEHIDVLPVSVLLNRYHEYVLLLRLTGQREIGDYLEHVLEKLSCLSKDVSILQLLWRLMGTGSRPPQLSATQQRCISLEIEKPVYTESWLDESWLGAALPRLSIGPVESQMNDLFSMEPGSHASHLRASLGIDESANKVGRYDKYFRDLKGSLYGGLAHSHALDIHMTLSVPKLSVHYQLPKQHAADDEEFEDEGIYSGIASEGSMSPELTTTDDVKRNSLSIWDPSRHSKLSRRRTWEGTRSLSDDVTVQLVSESGKEGFDHFYNVRLLECQGLCDAPVAWRLVTEEQLIADVLYVLIGISSSSFKYDELGLAFVVCPNLRLSGVSMEAIHDLLDRFARMGGCYERLRRLCDQHITLISASACGTTLASFIWSIRQYLCSYLSAVTQLKGLTALSISQVYHAISMFGWQLRVLVDACFQKDDPSCLRPQFATGTSLLLYLHQLCCMNSSSRHYHIFLFILKRAMTTFLRFITDWVFSGRCLDRCDEFLIRVDNRYLGHRDKLFWTRLYHLKEDSAAQILPLFFDTSCKEIFNCGKLLNLLRAVAPCHYLFSLEIVHPLGDLVLTYDKMQAMSEKCHRYASNVKHLADVYHKERRLQLLIMLLEKEDAFVKEKERVRQFLTDAEERERAVHDALKSKKKLELTEMKQQMEDAIELKKQRKAEEVSLDLMYMAQAQKLDDESHARLQQARRELEEHYADLTAFAVARESRALWRIRRMELADKRNVYFKEQSCALENQMSKLRATMQDKMSNQHLEQEEDDERVEEMSLPNESGKEGIDIAKQLTPPTTEHMVHGNPSTSQDSLYPKDGNTGAANHGEIRKADQSNHGALQNETAATQREQSSHRADASVAQHLLYPDKDTHESSVQTPVRQADATVDGATTKQLLYPEENISTDNEKGRSSIGGHEEIWNVAVTRGKESPSMAQTLLYPDNHDAGVESHHGMTRGHEPPSNIKAILYPEPRGVGVAKGNIGVDQSEIAIDESWFDYVAQPYQDNFALMDQKPGTGLMLAQNEIEDEYDEDMIQLPLAELFRQCLLPPILTQVKLVNDAMLGFFLEDLQIKTHFMVFRKFVLLEDGEFGHALSKQLFEMMTPAATPSQVCSPIVLSGVINKALQWSIAADKFDLSDELSFSVTKLPEAFKSTDVFALDFLELTYKVPWPCNIIIDDTCVAKYNKVFSFLLKLKRMNWVLREVWRNLNHAGHGCRAAASPQLRHLQLCRHEMQHFVNNVDRYMVNQIIHSSWGEFEVELEHGITSLDKLIECHSSYLNKIIFRSLLSKNAAPVFKIISDVFGLMLKFHMQLHLSPWKTNAATGHVENALFKKMCTTHAAFKEFTGFLFSVVSKLVKRGYQHHLQDFLLQVNFNGYYATAVV